jgi:hypothetical protein
VLKLADKLLTGTIVAGGVAEGKASYRVVAGAGGWGRMIPRKPYRNDAGMKISNLISDVARTVGETVADVPTARVGSHYARAEGPASAVLNQLAPRGWRVDFDGVTRFGLRSSTAYTGDGTRTRIVPDAAFVEVAADEIGDLLPGVTIDGSQPATDVDYLLTADRLTVKVYASPQVDREQEAERSIMLALFPWLQYIGHFEYRVVGQTGERLNLQPVRAATRMPDLAGVPVRPGVASVKSTATPGALVLVVFADRDPSRPQVVAHDAADAPGFGVGAALPIARLGDPIIGGGGGTIGPTAGAPTVVSAL